MCWTILQCYIVLNCYDVLQCYDATICWPMLPYYDVLQCYDMLNDATMLQCYDVLQCYYMLNDATMCWTMLPTAALCCYRPTKDAHLSRVEEPSSSFSSSSLFSLSSKSFLSLPPSPLLLLFHVLSFLPRPRVFSPPFPFSRPILDCLFSPGFLSELLLSSQSYLPPFSSAFSWLLFSSLILCFVSPPQDQQKFNQIKSTCDRKAAEYTQLPFYHTLSWAPIDLQLSLKQDHLFSFSGQLKKNGRLKWSLNDVVLYGRVGCDWYGIVWYDMIRCGMVWYDKVLRYGMVWYGCRLWRQGNEGRGLKWSINGGATPSLTPTHTANTDQQNKMRLSVNCGRGSQTAPTNFDKILWIETNLWGCSEEDALENIMCLVPCTFSRCYPIWRWPILHGNIMFQREDICCIGWYLPW